MADSPDIVVIGAGFAGLCIGMLLKQAGIHTFTILEKASSLGGTWRDNAYPGAACDVPSLAYCFSFAPKFDWSRRWASQTEIISYMDRCADAGGLFPHMRFGVEVARADFDEKAVQWRIETTARERISARLLVSAVGQLNRPSVPAIRGIESFAGKAFHSARWPPGYDPAGKRVAVIGNAASAVQIVPAIAPRVKSLRVFQRSANWVLPKNDRAFSSVTRATFAKAPSVGRLARWWTWSIQESRFPIIRKDPVMGSVATWMAKRHLRRQVSDPDLYRKLLPDYPIGAKRVLISDDYYPALQMPNVRLVTAPIERVTEQGLLTHDGETIDCDTIVFATGFDSTAFLAPMHIAGAGGRTLASAWADGARGYLGISVAGFPNLFLLYGPNTNLGHNSILFMLECQARYIMRSVKEMMRLRLASIDVREEVQAEYDAQIQRDLARTVWCDVDKSWYRHGSGRITNNWPHSTARYYFRTLRFDLGRYESSAESRDHEGPLSPRDSSAPRRPARARP